MFVYLNVNEEVPYLCQSLEVIILLCNYLWEYIIWLYSETCRILYTKEKYIFISHREIFRANFGELSLTRLLRNLKKKMLPSNVRWTIRQRSSSQLKLESIQMIWRASIFIKVTGPRNMDPNIKYLIVDAVSGVRFHSSKMLIIKSPQRPQN